MSQLKTNSITNIANTGDANIVLGANGDTQVQSLNSGPLAGMRNALINGDFRIWQRGNDITNPPDQSYVADHWAVSSSATRVQINGDVPSGQGLSYSCKLHPNGTPAGSTRQALIQPVELVEQGRAGQFDVGTTWTLSYWMRGDGAGSILAQAEFRSGPNEGSGSINLLSETTNYTTTWTRYSHTFTIGSGVVPAATHTCLAVILFSGTAAAHSLYVTGVQLEPGPVATPFEHRPIATELALCQRYYQQIGSDSSVTAIVSVAAETTTQAYGVYYYAMPMRTAPSVTGGGAWQIYMLCCSVALTKYEHCCYNHTYIIAMIAIISTIAFFTLCI